MVFSIKFLSGAWAEVSGDWKRKFCGRSAGWEPKYCRDCERGASEICDELTKLVSAHCEYKSNWGIWCENPENIWDCRFREMWLKMWIKCELWSNQQIANQGGWFSVIMGYFARWEYFWTYQINRCLPNVVEFLGAIFHRAANLMLGEGWFGFGLCKDGTAGGR